VRESTSLRRAASGIVVASAECHVVAAGISEDEHIIAVLDDDGSIDPELNACGTGPDVSRNRCRKSAASLWQRDAVGWT
jgi:hypothetical protein